MIYKQCNLLKNFGATVIRTTTWLPEDYAIRGKVLKLKENGTWDNGWVVERVFGSVDEKLLPDSHSEIKGHRKATGDSK